MSHHLTLAVNRRCENCRNPDTWDPNGARIWDMDEPVQFITENALTRLDKILGHAEKLLLARAEAMRKQEDRYPRGSRLRA